MTKAAASKLLFGPERQGTNRERPLSIADISGLDLIGAGFPQLFNDSIIADGPKVITNNWSLQFYLVRSNNEDIDSRPYKLMGAMTSVYGNKTYNEEGLSYDLAAIVYDANLFIRRWPPRGGEIEDETRLFSLPAILADIEARLG